MMLSARLLCRSVYFVFLLRERDNDALPASPAFFSISLWPPPPPRGPYLSRSILLLPYHPSRFALFIPFLLVDPTFSADFFFFLLVRRFSFTAASLSLSRSLRKTFLFLCTRFIYIRRETRESFSWKCLGATSRAEVITSLCTKGFRIV